MSGATVAYNLRRNKVVERQLFVELLSRFARWKDVSRHLYIGFGGVYFEDYKLLHNVFDINKMISLEREEWMLARQEHNIPYGCITPFNSDTGQLLIDLEDYRSLSETEQLLLWLDYAAPSELATQMNEVRAIIPKLLSGDVLKVTFSLHTAWLGDGSNTDGLTRRLARLKNAIGEDSLPPGTSFRDVTLASLPICIWAS